MSLTTVGTLASTVCALAVAWRLGGTQGVGVLGGFLFGGGVAGLGLAWQMRTMRSRPDRLMSVHLVLFLFKLFFLGLSWVTLTGIPAAASRVDAKSFLLSYATTVLVVSFLGVHDLHKALTARRAAETSEAKGVVPR